MRDHSSVTLSTKMAENSEPAKRARKPNFTAAECTLLLTVAEENINIIKSKFTNAITNKNKSKMWEEITDQVNSLGVCKRSVTEIKEKWRGMVSSAKKVHSKIATDRQKTGRGSKAVSPKGETKKIIDFFGEDPSFSGITGGIESGKFISLLYYFNLSFLATLQQLRKCFCSLQQIKMQKRPTEYYFLVTLKKKRSQVLSCNRRTPLNQ